MVLIAASFGSTGLLGQAVKVKGGIQFGLAFNKLAIVAMEEAREGGAVVTNVVLFAMAMVTAFRVVIRIGFPVSIASGPVEML